MFILDVKKKYLKLFIILLITLFSISYSYSACANLPTNISIYSGSVLVGEFERESLNLIPANIKGSLNSNPLKVELKFTQTDSDCYSTDDVEFKLFPTGLYVIANSISSPSNSTLVASFTFNYNSQVPTAFSSSYRINPKSSSGSIKFQLDDTAPYFEQLKFEPNSPILPPNTTVNIEYRVVDSGSGLKSLRVSGSDNYDFTGNSSFSGKINEKLFNSKTYTFNVVDMLGNSYEEKLEFIVDSTKPTFSNFDIINHIKDSQGRYVSFTLDVTDNSYSLDDSVPQVYGDFSALSDTYSNVLGSCSKDALNPNKYTCKFNKIKIEKIDKTTNLEFSFRTQDVANNLAEQSFSESIFYDNQGPKINNFYLENSMGKRNVFSAYDDNVSIYLEFSDESLKDDLSFQEFRVISDFDDSFFDNIDEREYKNSKGHYKWDISDYIKKYSSVDKGTVTFRVSLHDPYGNPSYSSINVSFNNNVPKIKEITVIENDYSDDSIKDGLISSQEVINFRVLIEDDNLIDYTGKFIYAQLFPIGNYEENVSATRCVKVDETLTQCNFNQIKVRNGYLKKNISFVATDITANRDVEWYEVEIFARGDEVTESFRIRDIKITNVLNRNLISTSGANAWFEGNIENIHDDEEIYVVNYMIKSCNDSQMNPIVLGNRILYPQEIVRTLIGENEADRNFAFKVEVRTHPNFNDLNEKNMTCTIAIRKRDKETLFPDELVKFNVKFEFYDLPRDNLLKAHALSILDDAKDADFLGSWFDDVYKIYSVFDKACVTVNRISGLVSSFSSVWTGVSWVLRGFPPTMAVAEAGDKPVYPLRSAITEILTGENAYVKKMCDFITCRNGGLLGTFWDSTGFKESNLGQIMNGNWANEWNGALCSVGTEGSDKVKRDAIAQGASGSSNAD